MPLNTTRPQSLFRVAMACLALFGILGMPRFSSAMDESWLDALRGALLGATLVLLHLAFRLKRKSDGGHS